MRNYLFITLICLFLCVLSPPVFAQTEQPVTVKLECRGDYPADREYTFRFFVGATGYREENKLPEGVTSTVPETFTLRAGETKEVGRLKLDDSKVGTDYQASFYYSICQVPTEPVLTERGLLDMSEKRYYVSARGKSDGSDPNIKVSFDKTSTDFFEGATDIPTFVNEFPDKGATDLTVRLSEKLYADYPNPNDYTFFFFDDSGFLDGSYHIQGGSINQDIKNGDKINLDVGNTYTVSGLLEGVHYCIDPGYDAWEGFEHTNNFCAFHSSGTVPAAAGFDYAYDFWHPLHGEGNVPTIQTRAFPSVDVLDDPDQMYLITYSLARGSGGALSFNQVCANAALKNLPLPEVREMDVKTNYDKHSTKTNRYSELYFDVKIEPIFKKEGTLPSEYEIRFSNSIYPPISEGPGDVGETMRIGRINGAASVTGEKTENGEKDFESSYTFNIEPVSASVEEAKTHVTDIDTWFQADLFDSEDSSLFYKNLIFTDTVPSGAAEDISSRGDGSVLAWAEGETVYVSSGVRGKKVIMDEFYIPGAFSFSYHFKSLDVSNLHVKKSLRLTMAPMYSGTEKIIGLDKMDTKSLESLTLNLDSDLSLEGIENWDTGNLRELELDYCQDSVIKQISNWNTSKLETLKVSGGTFTDLTAFKNWDTGSLKDLSIKASSLKSLTGLEGWRTNSLKRLYFGGCSNITSVEAIKNWNVSGVEDFSYCFSGCDQVQKFDLSCWDMSSALTLEHCFYGCDSTTEIDLSSVHPVSVNNVYDMFKDCSALRTLRAPDWENVWSLVSTGFDAPGGQVFSGCSSLSGYSESKTSAAYCKSISSSGYFSTPSPGTRRPVTPGQVTPVSPKVYTPEATLTPGSMSKEEMPLPPKGKSVSNLQSLIDWGYVSFKKPGIYRYKVTEVPGGDEKVAYDSTEYTLTFNVTVNMEETGWGDPALDVSLDISPQKTIRFNNTRRQVAELKIPVEKILKNAPTDYSGTFTFHLDGEESEGLTMPENCDLTLAAGASGAFDAVTVSSPGSYTFTVTETAGSDENILYDKSSWQVVAQIGDTMEIDSITYTDSIPNSLSPPLQKESPVFVNTYVEPAEYAPKISKTVLSSTEKPSGTYTFKITESNTQPGAMMPEETTVMLDGEGEKSFSPIRFTAPGTYSFKIEEIPGDESYVEYDTVTYTLTVEVTGEEKLSIGTVSYKPQGD